MERYLADNNDQSQILTSFEGEGEGDGGPEGGDDGKAGHQQEEGEGEGGNEWGGGHSNNLLQEICLRLAKEDDSELMLVSIFGCDGISGRFRELKFQSVSENGQPGAGGGKVVGCS